MKNIILFAFFLLAMNSFASIEYTPSEDFQPTPAEIQNNRSCFKELKVLGCSNPGEDIEQFRSCMNNVYASLNKHCRNLMDDLYK